MSIGENWLAPQPTANIANAILTQAPWRCLVIVAAATTLTLTRGLVRERDGVYLVGPGGAAEFGDFGIDASRLERRTRPLLRPCLDGSERRYHLAGSLGAARTFSRLARRWISTREASRIVTVTRAGQA